METAQTRRIKRDEALLEDGRIDGLIISWHKCLLSNNACHVYEVVFQCYEGNHYVVRLHLPPDYPFRPPQAFFVGEAPRHPFYWWDTDDSERSKRVTNLANTDFGLFYAFWGAADTMLTYVERLKYSLTPEGTSEMKGFMKSIPLPVTTIDNRA